MKRIPAALLAVIIFWTACKQKPNTDNSSGDKSPGITSEADSSAIRETVTDFYDWYNNGYEKFFRFDLYDGIEKPDQPPYRINWENVTKYQQFITDSVPQLGRQFLANQKRFLGQCDSAFRADTTDEIPYGFDYDWYTNSQEGPEYLVKDLHEPKSKWDIRVNGDMADLKITSTREFEGKEETYTVISLSMQRENGRWKIAKIGTE